MPAVHDPASTPTPVPNYRGLEIYNIYLISSFGVLMVFYGSAHLDSLSEAVFRYFVGVAIGAFVVFGGSGLADNLSHSQSEKRPILWIIIAIVLPFFWLLLLLIYAWIAPREM